MLALESLLGCARLDMTCARTEGAFGERVKGTVVFSEERYSIAKRSCQKSLTALY